MALSARFIDPKLKSIDGRPPAPEELTADADEPVRMAFHHQMRVVREEAY